MKLITTAVALLMATSAIAHETFHTSSSGSGEQLVQLKTAEFSLDGNTWKHFRLLARSDESSCKGWLDTSAASTVTNFKEYANQYAIEGRTYEMSNSHTTCITIEEAIKLKVELPLEGWEEVSKHRKITAPKREYK